MKDRIEALLAWLGKTGDVLGLPEGAFAALVILLGGWGVAWVLGFLTRRLVERLVRRLPAAGSTAVAEVVDRRQAGQAVGRAVFWVVWFVFIMTATEVLGLAVVTAWFSGVVSYLPRLLIAVVIAFVGLVVGRLARGTVTRAARSAELVYAARLGRVTEIAIVLVSILVAIEQVGVEVRFVTGAVLIVLAALTGGAALAFGLGGRDIVANILAGHYVRKLYEVGNVVRIADTEGRIIRMTPTAVIVQSKEGETAIPTRHFADTVSTRVLREE